MAVGVVVASGDDWKAVVAVEAVAAAAAAVAVRRHLPAQFEAAEAVAAAAAAERLEVLAAAAA